MSSERLKTLIAQGEFEYPAHIKQNDFKKTHVSSKNQVIGNFTDSQLVDYVRKKTHTKTMLDAGMSRALLNDMEGIFISQFLDREEFEKAKIDRESKVADIDQKFKSELILSYCTSKNVRLNQYLASQAVERTNTHQAALLEMESLVAFSDEIVSLIASS